MSTITGIGLGLLAIVYTVQKLFLTVIASSSKQRADNLKLAKTGAFQIFRRFGEAVPLIGNAAFFFYDMYREKEEGKKIRKHDIPSSNSMKPATPSIPVNTAALYVEGKLFKTIPIDEFKTEKKRVGELSYSDLLRLFKYKA